MSFDLPARVRIATKRRLVRAILRSRRARTVFLWRQRSLLEAGLDPDTAIILALATLTGDDKLGAAPHPEVERTKMAESIAIAEDVPSGRLTITAPDLRLDGRGSIPARLYEPAIERPSAGLVFVHGGGWVTGDLDTHDTLCRRLALGGGIRVLAIAPRLAPEHPFPATIDDTLAAFRAIAANASSFGIDPSRLGIGGDSAGGNLSAVVGLETRHDTVRPATTLLLYPAVDATLSHRSIRTRGEGFLLTEASIAWYLDLYLGRAREAVRDPRVSPLLANDHRGAPPALVVVAGFDPLFDEGLAYAAKLEAAGVAVTVVREDSLIHGFALMTGLSPRALHATETIAQRIGALLRDPASTAARTT